MHFLSISKVSTFTGKSRYGMVSLFARTSPWSNVYIILYCTCWWELVIVHAYTHPHVRWACRGLIYPGYVIVGTWLQGLQGPSGSDNRIVPSDRGLQQETVDDDLVERAICGVNSHRVGVLRHERDRDSLPFGNATPRTLGACWTPTVSKRSLTDGKPDSGPRVPNCHQGQVSPLWYYPPSHPLLLSVSYHPPPSVTTPSVSIAHSCVCTATCQANLCTTLHATPRRKIKQTTSTFNTIDILVPPSHTHTYTATPPSHAGSETKVRLFPSPSRMNSSYKKKRHCSSANQLCALSWLRGCPVMTSPLRDSHSVSGISTNWLCCYFFFYC